MTDRRPLEGVFAGDSWQTDGGVPSAAGTVPVNASRLSSFLRDHADTPGFELPNIDEGGRTNEAVPRRRHRPDDVRSSTADDAAIGSDDSDFDERGVVERYSTSGVVHSFDTLYASG